MIRPFRARRVDTDQQFIDLPIVIAPGGGGASGLLDYEFLANFLPDNLLSPKYKQQGYISVPHRWAL